MPLCLSRTPAIRHVLSPMTPASLYVPLLGSSPFPFQHYLRNRGRFVQGGDAVELHLPHITDEPDDFLYSNITTWHGGSRLVFAHVMTPSYPCYGTSNIARCGDARVHMILYGWKACYLDRLSLTPGHRKASLTQGRSIGAPRVCSRQRSLLFGRLRTYAQAMFAVLPKLMR